LGESLGLAAKGGLKKSATGIVGPATAGVMTCAWAAPDPHSPLATDTPKTSAHLRTARFKKFMAPPALAFH
jgi:hypothetical protein